MFELQSCGGEAVSVGLSNEYLDELGLVAAYRVDVVCEVVDVGDAHGDREAADDRPLGFGWEAGERCYE